MAAFVRKRFAQVRLPENASVRPVYRQHHELVTVRHPHVVVGPRSAVEDGGTSVTHRHRRLEKHAFAKNDGRRVRFARQGNLPADVPGLTPLHWRIGERRDAVGQRTTPLRPRPEQLG